MLKENNNIPFKFERGKCKFQGSTDKDRETLRLEIKFYYIWRILIVISSFLGLKALYIFL